MRNTPPGPAAVASVTGYCRDCPTPSARLAGVCIGAEADATVTVAVAVPKFGTVAVITVEPAATAVTGTLTLVALAAKVTVAGTVATLGLLELRLTVRPELAPADRFKVSVPEAPTLRLRLEEEKELLPPDDITWTCVLADV